MEVIFQHQLTHQRTLIGAIGRARRMWKYHYGWYPVEQNCVYSHMDRIYKETREKYGDELFMEVARMKRLNERLYKSKKEMSDNGPQSSEMTKECGRLGKKCYL